MGAVLTHSFGKTINTIMATTNNIINMLPLVSVNPITDFHRKTNTTLCTPYDEPLSLKTLAMFAASPQDREQYAHIDQSIIPLERFIDETPKKCAHFGLRVQMQTLENYLTTGCEGCFFDMCDLPYGFPFIYDSEPHEGWTMTDRSCLTQHTTFEFAVEDLGVNKPMKLFHFDPDNECLGPYYINRPFDPKQLLQSGDVETNPGPQPNLRHSPIFSRNNCSRGGLQKMSYRERSDPDNREDWWLREMRKVENDFHACTTEVERVQVVAQAIEATMTKLDVAGCVAQIFGFSNPNVIGVETLAATIERVVDNTNASVHNVRQDVIDAISSIPNVIGEVLNTQAGFLPISIRTIILCLMSLVGLYIIKRFICLSYDFFALVYGAFKAIFSGCSSIFECFDEWVTTPQMTCGEAQVGVEDVAAIATEWIPKCVPMMLSMLVAGTATTMKSRDNSPDAWLRRMDLLPRACKGLGEIHKFATQWFTTALSYAKELIYGPDPLDERNGLPMVTAWMDDVVAASREISTICRNRAGCERVKALWFRGDQLLKNYRNVMDRSTVDDVKRMLQLAARMKDTAENTYGRPKGVRAVPQLVWLVGESQIGKSTMQYFLAAELLAEFGMAKDIEDQMYMRAVEQEYADGYNGQYVWVIDDAFQMRDSASAPNIEFFEIIRAVGNFPYALHMADISQKANTYFDSKSLICSTNNANLDIQSLTYPEAVFNRFAFAYHVHVKPEYRKIKQMKGMPIITLNKERAMRDAPIVDGKKMPFNLNVYEFVRFDPCNPDRVEQEPPISFHEMVAELRADLRARDNQSIGLSAMLKTYAERIDAGKRGDQDDAAVGEAQNGEVERDILHETPYAKMTLKELRDRWLKVEEEPDTFQNAERKLDGRIIRCELDNLPYGESTPLKDVNWREHVVTPQEVIASIFQTIPSTNKGAILGELAAMIRCKWERTRTGIQEGWERLAVPVFDSVAKFFVDFFSKPMYVIGALSSIALVVIYLKRQPATVNVTTNIGGHAESDTRNQQPKARVHVRSAAKTAFKSSRAKAEMAEDAMQQQIIDKVRRNQFAISAIHTHDGDDVKLFYGNGLVVSGSILMMPYHFLIAMTDIYKAHTVVLHRHDAIHGVEMKIEDFKKDYIWQEEHDVAFFNLKRRMPQRANLVKLFASHDRSSRLEGTFRGTLSGYRNEKDGLELLLNKGFVRPVDGARYELGTELITIRDVYEYDIDTKKGDCGMILTVCDKQSTDKIIGMHVAGTKTGKNWACAVWREMIEEALKQFDCVAQMAGSYSHLEPCEMSLAGEFLPVGKLPDGPSEIAKSNIIPSTLHGKISEPTCKPARLRPFTFDGKLIDPLRIGAEKGGKALPLIDEKKLKIVVDHVFHEMAYNHRDRKIDMRVLTYEESIAGAEAEEMIHGISRVTSPGYPYSREKGRGKGKTKWMGRDDYDFTSEDALKLKADVEDLDRKAKTGGRLDVLWIDTLKDERRPIEKVDQGKTRVFSNGPMHFNILFRKYFQSAITHIQHNRIYNGSGVGLNVWSAEWEALRKYLTKFGDDNLFDGDLSGLDVSLKDQILWGVENILDRLYDDEHSVEREALWMQVVYATRFFRGTVYQALHNVPSGLPGTTIVDTIALKICFGLIWLELAPPELRTMRAYGEHVRIVIYGDDNVVAVSDVAKGFFNMETVSKGFTLLGMVYTDANKTGEVVPLKNISEVQFLKRRFVYSKFLGRHTCPADLESRLESLNWTRNNNVIDTRVIEVDTIQNVLQELAAFCDIDFYDLWSRRILRAARDANLPGLVDEGFFHYHIPKEERV